MPARSGEVRGAMRFPSAKPWISLDTIYIYYIYTYYRLMMFHAEKIKFFGCIRDTRKLESEAIGIRGSSLAFACQNGRDAKKTMSGPCFSKFKRTP